MLIIFCFYLSLSSSLLSLLVHCYVSLTMTPGHIQGLSSDFHPLITTKHNNNINNHFRLKPDVTPSKQNKSWGKELLASWDKQTNTHTYTVYIHMLENRGRLENVRGRCYVTCEREEVVSKRWSRRDEGKIPRGSRGRMHSKIQCMCSMSQINKTWNYDRGMC